MDYDTGESNTVIPHYMRRPRSTPRGTPPHTPHHTGSPQMLSDLQPPIRPISAMEATDALVWDRQSVCHRLLARLEALYTADVPLWRREVDR